MVRLALKAFYPLDHIPFPLLHVVHGTHKLRKMSRVRWVSSRPTLGGLKTLIVHSNTSALEAGANPFSSGPSAAAAC